MKEREKRRKKEVNFIENLFTIKQKKLLIALNACALNTCFVLYICFPDGTVVKNIPANAGDAGSAGLIPESGRSPGEGKGNPLQYSYLDNSMDRGTGRLQPRGSQRVRHNWAQTHTQIHTPYI